MLHRPLLASRPRRRLSSTSGRRVRHPALPAAFLVLLAMAGCYVGWSLQGSFGLAVAVVLLSPLIGIAVALVFSQLLSSSLQAIRQLAYSELEGRHYAYKGRPLVVFEDPDGDRWIQTDGIRQIIPGLPRDALLARLAGTSCAVSEAGNAVIRAQALNAYLAKNQDDVAVRFRNWLQREVIFPADTARIRLSNSRSSRSDAP
jgi:hypothetical protein